MKRVAFAIFAALLVAAPASAQWDSHKRIDSPTITGPLTLTETLATDLSAQTCAGWGLTTPIGAWSCTDSPLTITRTASGSDLTLTYSGTQTVVPGVAYEIVATYTITAASFSSTIGGRVGATYSTTATMHEYFPAGTSGKHIITAVAASAGTITGISVNAITNTISASEGPIVSAAALTSAGNQSGAVLAVTGTKSAGTMSALDIVDAGSGGTRYFFRGFSGATQNTFLSTAGVLSVAQIGSSGPFNSTRASVTSNGTFTHIATIPPASLGAGASFHSGITLGAMDGSDSFAAFRAAITNANHTGSGNTIFGFDAPNITGDAEASEYALNIGTGWDAPIALAAATANGTVAALFTATSAPTGAQTAIQGWIRVDVAGTPRYVPFW